MTSYRNCPSCCPLCSTHISSIKALIYNFAQSCYLHLNFYIWHTFVPFLKNVSRFVAVHFVIGYTPIWCKIRRQWGLCSWFTATNPHWKFLIQKSTNSASKTWWRSILLPDHTAIPWWCSICFVCFVEISAILMKKSTSTFAQVPAQTVTHQKLNSSFIILCWFS